jgi:hypothetical protein
MRALPAGPTVIDMLANAAYLIGLSLWLADQDERWTYAVSFERADEIFTGCLNKAFGTVDVAHRAADKHG